MQLTMVLMMMTKAATAESSFNWLYRWSPRPLPPCALAQLPDTVPTHPNSHTPSAHAMPFWAKSLVSGRSLNCHMYQSWGGGLRDTRATVCYQLLLDVWVDIVHDTIVAVHNALQTTACHTRI